MKEIKFSSDYPKLWQQKYAYLVQVRIIDKGCVCEALNEYDTKKSDGTYYKLPDTDLIQLIFVGEYDIPFCTLRRWTPQKEEYYESCVGEEFKVVIGDEA